MDSLLRMNPDKISWAVRDRIKALRISTRLKLPFLRRSKGPRSASLSARSSGRMARGPLQTGAPDPNRPVSIEFIAGDKAGGTGLERVKLLSLLCPNCKRPSLYNVKQPRLSHLLVCPGCQMPFTSRLVLIRASKSTRTTLYREYSVRGVDELGVEHLFEFIDHKNASPISIRNGDLVSIAYIGDWPITVENFHEGQFWVLSDTPKAVRRRWVLTLSALAGLILVIAFGLSTGSFLRNGVLSFAGMSLESAWSSITSLIRVAPTDSGSATAAGLSTHNSGALGETARIDGYALTAIDLREAVDLGGDRAADTGMKLIGVDVEVGNISNARALNVTPLSFTLLDAIGNQYPVQVGGCKGQIATQELGPGETLRGCVSFQVPLATVATVVQYPVSNQPRVIVQAGIVR